MRATRYWLLGIALFQGVSTTVGAVELLVTPQWFAPMLDGTLFQGRYVLASLLLGVLVGGFQWTAVALQLRLPTRLTLGHTTAAVVMIGWIAGECLILDSFFWPHALWGGVAVVQLLLVVALLGGLKENPVPLSQHPARIP